MSLTVPRRTFLLGLAAGIVAPAIVKTEHLMPVKVMEWTAPKPKLLMIWHAEAGYFTVFRPDKAVEWKYIGEANHEGGAVYAPTEIIHQPGTYQPHIVGGRDFWRTDGAWL